MGIFAKKIGIAAFLLTFVNVVFAQRHSDVVTVGTHKIRVTFWESQQISDKPPTVVLLSGPTDNWNSDSAWFARLAPKLSKTHRVITVDRGGQFLATKKAAVGYSQFADDLAGVIDFYQLKNIKVIAFASANLTLNRYFATHKVHSVDSVILIDPDVLTTYSITRYKKDALPFKQNLQEYLEYIGKGKYSARALEKNQQEMKHLKHLAAGDIETDWDYVEEMFSARLKIANLQNLFSEIARYGEDLDSAMKAGFPDNIPLVVIDTNFEQNYIEQSDEEKTKKELSEWRDDARSFYLKLTKNSINGRYIPLESKEHLVPFSDPELLVDLVVNKAR